MLDRIFFWRRTNKALELNNLEKLLEINMQPIKPRYGYQANLKQRLTDYPLSISDLVIQHKPGAQQTLQLNEPLFLILGILSGAALLAMGIRILFLILATLGLARNLKRKIRRTDWPSSPHAMV